MNYHNEFDPYAAQWLRNLIAAGLIPPGVVDERSIEDVHPDDLREFVQCHFFAGIGGWPIALRAAGWPDDRPVWTGSCPCQPFSSAGEGAGFADERHLWPAFYHLIGERRPAAILGEQVASKDADPWIDLVHADLEAVDYAFGSIPFPAASIGTPNIRDRLYWVANANGIIGGKGRQKLRGRAAGSDAQPWSGLGGSGVPRGMGDTDNAGLEGYTGNGGAAGRQGSERSASAASVSVRMADNDSIGCAPLSGAGLHDPEHHAEPCGITGGLVDGERPGPTNGQWRDSDWLFCRDAKWRPVEAGTFPLANGLPRGVGSGGAGLERLAGLAGLDNASLTRAKSYRVGTLRGYGNAINPEQARQFIKAVMEHMP